MGKKLLFFDIDGTLYDNEKKIVHQSTIDAIKKISKNDNYIIALASGRGIYALHSLKELLSLFDYKVLVNGQTIFYKDKLVYDNPICDKDCEQVVNKFIEEGVAFGLMGAHSEAISVDNELTRKVTEFLDSDFPLVDPYYYKKEKIYQIWAYEDCDFIRSYKQPSTLKLVRWYTNGIDLIPSGTSKVTGIKYIAEKENIKKEDIIAFGDGENDIEMLEYSGIGVCMGNGVEQTKKVADFVTDHVSNNGLVNALKKLDII